MGNEVNPPGPRRLRQGAVLGAVFCTGLLLGVLGDRLSLEITRRTSDARLIGDWVAVGGAANEDNVWRFCEDGTYESALWKKADGKFAQVWHTTYQYRWVDREAIEMYDPFHGWTTRKLVFEGDQV